MGAWRGQGKEREIRQHVFKDQVEWNTGGTLGMDGDVAQWLVRWAGMVQTGKRWKNAVGENARE